MKLLTVLAVLVSSSVMSNAAPTAIDVVKRETTVEEDELTLRNILEKADRIPVRAIDVHPDSTFEGLPVNDTLIVGYRVVYPESKIEEIDSLQNRIHEKREALHPRSESPNLLERQANGPWSYWSTGCTINNQWLLQWQAHIAKTHVCGVFANGGGYWGGCSHGAGQCTSWGSYTELNWWDGNNNQWKPLTNHYGGPLRTAWHVQHLLGFDWQLCVNQFGFIIDVCHGTNPDCSSGTVSASTPASPSTISRARLEVFI